MIRNALLIVMGLAVAMPAAAQRMQTVEVATLDGLPPDSLQRTQFLAGFESAFALTQLDREISGVAGWSALPAIPNAFHLQPAGAERGAWGLQVTVVLPPIHRGSVPTIEYPGGRGPVPGHRQWTEPKHRASRRMTVLVVALNPNEMRIESGPSPDSVSVQFAGPAPSGEGMPVPPLHGVEYPWRLAGRTAGLLALESLHHRSRDLSDRERLALPGATRVAAEN